MVNSHSVSIYSREEIREELARQREILRVRGLSGRVVIGSAPNPPAPARMTADAVWLQCLLLGK